MNPPFPLEGPSNWISSVAVAPTSILSRNPRVGLARTSCFKISSAFDQNIFVERRTAALLFSTMYLISLTGKVKDSGKAMASCARMERNVTR